MSRSIYSQTRAAAAREGIARPIVVERTLEGLPDELLDALQAFAESARGLPRPFQQVVGVERRAGRLEVALERFSGVTGLQLISGLHRAGRLLPLPVWLQVADAWLRAVEQITPANDPAWKTSWTHAHVGADITGALVFTFDAHNHVLGHWPSPVIQRPGGMIGPSLPVNLTPEAVRAEPQGEPSRVHCLGSALIMLLTLEHAFTADSELARLQAIVEGRPQWHPERHPQCPRALAEVLDRAILRAPGSRWPTIGALRQALLDAAGVKPAEPDEVARAFFGARPDRIREVFAQLEGDVALLPAAWRAGGLQVMEDGLLERAAQLDDFPTNQTPLPRGAPGAPLKINLAPVPRPWWQRLLGR